MKKKKKIEPHVKLHFNQISQFDNYSILLTIICSLQRNKFTAFPKYDFILVYVGWLNIYSLSGHIAAGRAEEERQAIMIAAGREGEETIMIATCMTREGDRQ